MDKLINDGKLLETEVRSAGSGTVTYLRNKNGISHQSQAMHADGSIIASYVYDRSGGYKLVYTQLDQTGRVLGHFREAGILPTLFKSPSGQLWVSFVVYHPDKEQEISVPVFERENFAMPKPGRPFTGDFVGTNENAAFFLDADIYFGKKPDKLRQLEFVNGTIIKKRDTKLDLPAKNKVSFTGREIHLLAFDNGELLHRQIDADGKVLNSRKIDIPGINAFEVLQLSFSGSSSLVAFTDDRFLLLTINGQGATTVKELIAVGSDIFSLWAPERLDSNTFLFRFTTEKGNGWIVVGGDRVKECFVHEEKKEYLDLVNKEKLKFSHDRLILSGANKTSGKGYAITIHPYAEDSPKELIILNRQFE